MPTFPWSPIFTFSSSSIAFTGLCSSTNTVKFANTTVVTFSSLTGLFSVFIKALIKRSKEMTRPLSWIPTPHVTEQDDHDDQSDHVGQNSRGA